MNIEDFLSLGSPQEEQKAKSSQNQQQNILSNSNEQISLEKKESVKKEKKIRKRQRKRKPKICSQRTGEKGRPKKQLFRKQSFSISEDETNPIKILFLNYLNSIGLVKGLVFKPFLRKRLQTEQKKKKVQYQIKWKNNHQWKKANEEKKIEEKLAILAEQTSYNFDFLKETFLDIGDIFADEATSEIYDFLIGIIKDILEDKSYLEELFTSSIFLTRKFTKINDPLECPMIKDQQQIHQIYSEFYNKVKIEMQKLMETTSK